MSENLKKRRRSSALDQLKPNWRDEKYAKVSQEKEYWQVTRGAAVTPQTILSKHRRAVRAICERWTPDAFYMRPDNDEDHFPLIDDDAEVDRYKGFYDDRRTAIKYLFFVVFGAPNEVEWHEINLIPVISHMNCLDAGR